MSILEECADIFQGLEKLPLNDKISTINEIRKELSTYSPFNQEPVDCVEWVKTDSVTANDYNPNNVAPPEMELLRLSVMADGYTQPVVTFKSDSSREVVDGFHRTRVAKECADVTKRIHGYVPVVTIKDTRKGRNDRIASTIRHNRARGAHSINGMSDIVIELKKRNWSDKKVGKELGMDEDEVLRLCQITGLAGLFTDNEFSESWDIGIFDDEAMEGELIGDA